MTDRHNLRDKIARALHDSATAKARKESAHVSSFEDAAGYFRATLNDQADAALAALDLDKIKAEAQVEVLREMADTLARAEPQHLGYATEGLEYFDYGTGAEYGIDVAAAYLRNAANETARSAGIETGENDD